MDSLNQRRKVRVVARIRGFEDRNPPTEQLISVRRLQSESFGKGRVVISSAGEQTSSNKQCNYEVDDCYEQEAGNDVIFSEEIQPLISSVFEGQSATVFAYGARGSGKTYTIQGSEHVPGLITLSMSEFLTRAEEVGNSISISLYEVLQDQVFDLLDSRKPVSVLEDAQGKITLKGLSEVTVKSMSEFQKLYFPLLRRLLQKNANEPPQSQRIHKGMIINVLSSMDKLSDASLLGRMNLVDLAGYEDRRQSCSGPDLIGISRINRSLYAVRNVLHALNGKETHVPYRESKLTRMLQESLGGTNRILLIAFMNLSFSEDTVRTLGLASRSCQLSHKARVDSTSRVKNLIKPTVEPSSSTKPTLALSSKAVKVASTSASTRKQVGSLLHGIERKHQVIEVEARRLFEELNESDITNKESVPKNDIGVTESSKEEGEKNVVNTSTRMEPSLVGSIEEENIVDGTPVVNYALATQDIRQEDKENKSLILNEGPSPPLSARLQELSNNLKSLYTSSPLNMKTAQENYNSIQNDKLENDSLEPRTPVPQLSISASNKGPYSNITSPWERFHIHNSGMKDSLVQEYLNFVNSASKEELKELKGIGEARAGYMLKLRAESPEPFKNLDDLKKVGLSSKQINGMMKKLAGDLFS